MKVTSCICDQGSQSLLISGNYSPVLCTLRINLILPPLMLIEDQRFLHEDLERLEQGISDRIAEDPRNVSRVRLAHADVLLLIKFL